MLNIDKCFYVLKWSHSFYPLFFFDVVYPIYWYLDVEPSLPLVSTFHLPLPVSGARLQSLTIIACASRPLVPCRCSAIGFTAWDTGMVSSSSESAWVTASSTVGAAEGEWEAWLHGCLPCRLHCCGWGPLCWTPQFYQTASKSRSLLSRITVMALWTVLFCPGPRTVYFPHSIRGDPFKTHLRTDPSSASSSHLT